MTYVEANNFDATIGNVQFNQTGANEVGLTWDSSNGQGVTVPDGTTMFSICFDVAACSGADRMGSLAFVSGSQVPIEVGNGDAEPVLTNFQPCGYIIDCGGDGECAVNFGVANISPPSCFGGANGGITVNPTVSGAGCTMVSCTWFQGTPGGQMIPSTDCNLTGVAPGDYFLVVTTSDGITHQEDYTIPNTQALTITSTIFPVTCNSLGGVNTTITGGSGTYNCEWEHNGAIGCNIGGLISGTYTLLITDAITGCSQVAEFPIGTDFNLIGTMNTTGADCGGGTASVTLNQSGVFNYNWSHSGSTNAATQNNLDPGIYTCTVTDENGNCSTTVTGEVTFDASPIMIQTLPIPTTDASCNGAGGTATINIVGGCLPYDCSVMSTDGTPYTCDNLQNLPAGDYDVVIMDASNNAGINASFSISAFVEIDFGISATNVSSSGPGQILTNVSGGEGPYTYNWNTTEGGGLIQGASDQTMLEVGAYFLTVTDANGCTASTEQSISNENPDPPACSQVFITEPGCANDCNGAFQCSIVGEGPFVFALTNSTGVTIETNELPITDLCADAYTLVITDVFGQQSTETFTINGPDAIEIVLDDEECDNGSNSGSLSILTTGGSGGLAPLWSNGNMTNNPEDLMEGTYEVVITDVNECSVSQIFTVERCDDIGPGGAQCGDSSTVLTPNGDSENATLNVICASDYPNTFGVYDRFGRLVYEASNYNGEWDGTDMNGEIVTEGVYYWVMDSTFDNGDHRIFKGYVNVIRETK